MKATSLRNSYCIETILTDIMFRSFKINAQFLIKNVEKLFVHLIYIFEKYSL